MIVDAHLDLAFNALAFERDLRLPLAEVRAAEARRQPRLRDVTTVTLPALRQGGVGLVFGTLYTMPAYAAQRLHVADALTYRDASEGHARAMAQLDYYRRLADEVDFVRLVTGRSTLQEVIESHRSTDVTPLLGIVLLMEGGGQLREPETLEEWVENGVRLLGPAWDDTRYAAGAFRPTGAGFTHDGFKLLEIMADLGVILDLTHLSDRAVADALDRFAGTVASTHTNARAIRSGTRQHSDEQIRRIGERGGVIGIALANGMLKEDYARSDPKETVTLDNVVAHIDHICQLLGTAAHVGIGSDLDGGFGRASIPAELDSAADLGLIGDRLKQRGYAPADVDRIMSGNWLRVLDEAWSG